MRINGIGCNNIMPVGLNTRNVGNVEMNLSKDITLQLDALFTTGNPVTGESASIYYDESYTEDNPVMLVKGEKSDGTAYEQRVNIKDVKTGQASYVEMIALTTYLAKQGKLGDADLGINTNECQYNDMFTKQDFMGPLKQMMQWQLENKNMDGYAYFSEKIRALEKHQGRLPQSKNKYNLLSENLNSFIIKNDL